MCGLNEVIWFVRISFSKALSIELARVRIPEMLQYGLHIPFGRIKCCSRGISSPDLRCQSLALLVEKGDSLYT